METVYPFSSESPRGGGSNACSNCPDSRSTNTHRSLYVRFKELGIEWVFLTRLLKEVARFGHEKLLVQ